jgi:hypothetical protein
MKVDYNNMSKIREEDDNNNGRGKLIKVSQTTEKEDKITPSPKSILNLQLQASASPLCYCCFYPYILHSYIFIPKLNAISILAKDGAPPPNRGAAAPHRNRPAASTVVALLGPVQSMQIETPTSCRGAHPPAAWSYVGQPHSS